MSFTVSQCTAQNTFKTFKHTKQLLSWSFFGALPPHKGLQSIKSLTSLNSGFMNCFHTQVSQKKTSDHMYTAVPFIPFTKVSFYFQFLSFFYSANSQLCLQPYDTYFLLSAQNITCPPNVHFP